MHHGLSKEGGGGYPHLFPSQSMMGSFSHWSLPSHVIPFFLYKNHRPISCFHTHRWSDYSFGLMDLVDPLACWLHPSHWCLLNILACLLGLLPGLLGCPPPIGRLWLIPEYTSCWWLRPKSLQWPVLGVDHGKDHWVPPDRCRRLVLKGHDQMNSLVNGSVSAVGLEHSQPCAWIIDHGHVSYINGIRF